MCIQYFSLPLCRYTYIYIIIIIIIIIIIKSLLKHASTQSKAHKTNTRSEKGQASYIRPNIYAEKSNVCNLLLKQDIRLVLK